MAFVRENCATEFFLVGFLKVDSGRVGLFVLHHTGSMSFVLVDFLSVWGSPV